MSISPHICYTAAGCLIHENKVLLVKHKKVKAWLNPGGHIEEDELPHQAAEREFWEETGVRVKAIDPFHIKWNKVDNSEYLPNPFGTNVHWVCEENFERRKQGKKPPKGSAWKNGCEQHLGFLYLVEPAMPGEVEFYENVEETDGIAWFGQEELAEIEVFQNVRQEIEQAFELKANR